MVAHMSVWSEVAALRVEPVAPSPIGTSADTESGGILRASGGPVVTEAKPSPPFGGSPTGQAVADALEQVNQLQFDADRKVEDLALGRADSIHEAVIALEKANMALQFTIQVSKKAVEAYQEIMRMPV